MGLTANADQPRDVEVDRAVALIHAARARLEAVSLNRAGDFERARRAVRGVARRIDTYANGDAELTTLASALVAEQTAFSAPMPEVSRKVWHAQAVNLQRSRDARGRARR